MDRTEAATLLLRWQLDGEAEPPCPAGSEAGAGLVALVESVARGRERPPVEAPEPAAPPGFLRLDEEEAVLTLRAKLRTLGAMLDPEERRRLEARLHDVMPGGEIARVREELDRFSERLLRRPESGSAPARAPESAPVVLRAVLLFGRDGRLLSAEGEPGREDLASLSGLVARGEPGTTWTLGLGDGTAVGHVGARAGLVAVFSGRPGPSVGGTLRVSLASLEQKDRLASALTHPSSHQTLAAYVRAVRSLLARGA